MSSSRARAEGWRNARRRPRSYENRFSVELGPLHDVGFYVGAPESIQSLITCHKLMLARCSDVFSEMFFGGAEVFTYDDDDPILVPDVPPEAFETMVDYVYSGELYVEKFEVGCGVMYAAKKYQLTDLEQKCRSFLWTRIYPNNVFRALDFAKQNDEKQIYETALEILQRKTSKLIEHRSFEKASQNALVLMLEQDELNVNSELELYEACLRWARFEAMRKGLDKEDPEILKKMLGPALNLIRFLAISSKEMSILGDEILTEDDYDNLNNNIIIEGYCTIDEPRIIPDHKTFSTIEFNDECCLDTIDSEYFENTFDVFALAFSASGDFYSTQLGVQIPTQVKPAESEDDTYEEDLTIILYDWSEGKMLCTTHFKSEVKYDTVIDVPFDEKVALDKKRVRKIVKVIFHKAGTYPSRYRLEDNKDSEFKCCTFDGNEDAKLFYKKSYTYVHFCAYTVDS